MDTIETSREWKRTEMPWDMKFIRKYKWSVENLKKRIGMSRKFEWYNVYIEKGSMHPIIEIKIPDEELAKYEVGYAKRYIFKFHALEDELRKITKWKRTEIINMETETDGNNKKLWHIWLEARY